jgi:hypothetical protein
MEYLSKCYFNFENTYFTEIYTFDSIKFKYNLEYFQTPHHILKLNISCTFNAPLEFISFRSAFFKNNFYHFFFKRTTFYLSNTPANILWKDFSFLKKNYFMQYKYTVVNNIYYNKKLISFNKIKVFELLDVSNLNISLNIYIYIYKILLLLNNIKFF